MAHNGNQYDFPLLKAELKKVGVTLPRGTLCADSYLGMKEIFRKREEVQHYPKESYRHTQDFKVVVEPSKNENLIKKIDEECKKNWKWKL